MNHPYLYYAIPTFFILIFLEAIYSHIKGLKLYNLRNSLSALGCGMFAAGLEVFLKAALLSAYVWVYDNFAWTELPDDSWLTWIAALLVFDFIWYWAHRISHEVNVIWGGHVPHHQSEEFNLSTGLRQGALQDTMYWPLYILMAPLGFSAEMFIAHVLINKFYGFWLHTQAIEKIPFIEGILSTPSAHRVHHGMNSQYINKNYGGIFIVFDRLFGTYQEENEKVIYGVRKRYASYNPVWAHFDWLYGIWKDAKLANNTWDKIRIWFMPTGWRPQGFEEQYPRDRVSMESYSKFDALPRHYTSYWLLLVFAVLAAGSQVLIVQSEALSWSGKLLLFGAITAGLYALGRLLNSSMQESNLPS